MLPSSLTRTRSWLAAIALVTMVQVASAQAPDSEPTARLEVQGNPDCASLSDLVARVRVRAPKIRFVDDAMALGIRAEFTTLASGQIEGVLVLSAPGDKPVRRRLVARSCAEAADGLALIIAVTLGQEDLGQVGQGSPDGAAPVPADGKPDKRAPDSASTADADTDSREGTQNERDATKSEGESQAESSKDLRLTLEAHLAAVGFWGPSPGLMPGIAGHLLGGFDRDSALSPAVSLGFTRSWRTGLVQVGGTADFFLDAAMLDVCPVRFRLPGFDFRPCGAVLLGRLSVTGRATEDPAGTQERFFGSAGASLWLTGRLGWIIEPSLRGSVGASLQRDKFTFTPVVFHEVPPVTASVCLGLAIRTP